MPINQAEIQAAIAFLVLSSMVNTADAQPPTSHFLTPEVLAIRRVVILPLDNRTSVRNAGEQLRQDLAGQIRAAGLFDISAPSMEDMPSRFHCGLRPAGFDEAVVAEAARYYRADGVMLGQLSEYSPYWPPRIGAAVHVIWAEESVPLASVDGHWDAGNEATAQAAIRAYHHMHPHQAQPSDEVALYAPRFFRAFVAEQIVQRLGSKLRTITLPPILNESGWSTPPILDRSP